MQNVGYSTTKSYHLRVRKLFKTKSLLLIIIFISIFSINSMAQDIDSELDYLDSVVDSETAESSEQDYSTELGQSEEFSEFDENPTADNAATQDTSTTTAEQSDEIIVEQPENPYVDYTNPATDGEVIVERFKDNTAPYKERRSRFGVTFAVNYEQFSPSDYYSLIHSDTYGNLAGGASIPLIGAELGLKYNFSLGSLAVVAGYSMGEMSDSIVGIDEMSMAITKISANYTMDNLFSEPYVAPFVQVGAHIIDWTEVGTVGGNTQEENITSQPTMHVKAGLSFQLNWIEKSIDPSTQEDALRSSGLENTYVDLYLTKYFEPSGASDSSADGEANFASSEIGVGLKLEF